MRVVHCAALPLLLGSFVACVDSEDPLARPIPTGSDEGRLVPYGLDGGGGAIIEENIYDTVLDVECAPAKDTFGVTRCLPYHQGYLGFRDDECTKPIAWMPTYDDQPPAFVRVTGARTTCGSPSEIAYRTGRLIDDELPRFTLMDGLCQRRPSSLTSAGAGASYEVERVDPTYFAALGVRSEAVTERVDRAIARAPDGTEFVTGLLDSQHGFACSRHAVEDQSLCRPKWSAFATSFTDAACTDRVVSLFDGACFEQPSFVFVQDSCFDRELVRIGERVDPSVAIYGTYTDGQCRLLGGALGGPSRTPYEMEPVDPAAVLAKLEPVEVGDGRLVVRRPGPKGGTAPSNGSFYDKELEQSCWPQTLPLSGDDTLRCFPPVGVAQTYFTDAACTTELRMALTLFGSVQALIVDGEQLFEAVVLEDVPPLFKRLGAECLAESPLLSACGQYASLGAPIDVAGFAIITRGVIGR